MQELPYVKRKAGARPTLINGIKGFELEPIEINEYSGIWQITAFLWLTLTVCQCQIVSQRCYSGTAARHYNTENNTCRSALSSL